MKIRFASITRWACVIGLAACLVASSARAATKTVGISGFAFQPPSVTINVGDTVTWQDFDNSGHTTTSDTGVWSSPALNSTSFSFTFTTAGSFPYHCKPHPFMTGTVIVNGAANQPPTVSIASPANGAVLAAPFSGTIQATAADPDGTVAKVDFLANGNLLGTVTQAPFNFQVSSLAAGSYTLTATATDNQGASTTSSPVMVTIDAPPSVSISSPSDGAVLSAPFTGSIQAAAADSDGTVTKVDFFANGGLVATATQAPFSVTISNAPAGTYTLTATATDDKGLSTTSSPVTVTVAVAVNAAPIVSLSSPTNDTLFVTGTNVTLVASASDTDDSVAQVAFYRLIFQPGPLPPALQLLGVVTTSPYTLTLTNVQPGFIHVVAVATDSRGATNQSDAVRLIVYTPVQFSSAQLQADGTVKINFTGTSFVIEASADFQSWTQVADSPTQNADGSWTLVDTQAKTFPRRFYRAHHVFNEVLPL
ncbi:MAG: Ig-like domain-containing protein [Limisphaerales bacterium]